MQIADDRFSARARTASDDERTRWWPIMTAAWPAYDEYQTKTDRPIPIVVLERERADRPAALPRRALRAAAT